MVLSGLEGPLQALLALGGSLTVRDLFAEPNLGTRLPGTPEDFSGALADPEPLFAAPELPQ